MKSLTNAFTLIEVLISVIILAVVGTGLLQISMNSKNNFLFLKEQSQFNRLASIPFIHNNQRYHNKDMNLYDFLRDDYPNLDDDLRKYLKNIKINYLHEEYSTFSPFNDANTTNNNQEENKVNLTIIYDKIIVKNQHNSTYTYKIYIPFKGNSL